MARLPSTILALAFAAAPAASQSINVDFEPIPNPYGALSVYHAGAAPSPGRWNSVSTTSVQDLAAADDSSTDVDLQAVNAGAFQHSLEMPPGGEIDKVFNDQWRGNTNPQGYGSAIWAFSGLAPGEYVVYTICISPTLGDGLLVQVTGSPDGTRVAYGDVESGYEEGFNFTVHRKTVTDGTIEITVSNIGFAPSDPSIAGIQLVRLPATGEMMCAGDGSSAACPCSNSGELGRGCENSAGTGGAFLTMSGSPGADTVVLHSVGELPSALTIFLQGTTNVGAANFGDGLRCTGGPLLRLYVRNASNGIVSAPQPGDPSIKTRAAALGQQIDPGDRRYYQAYYRDANASFCAPPQGANFNASQMLKLVW